ncbi:unnamed protein product [Sphagnum compactum]
MAEEEEEEEEEERELRSTSRSNGNSSSSTLLPNWEEYVNLEDVANRYLSEEIIPLQDVAGVQGAKQQNYLEKKLEQKCGTTKHMQQIAAAAADNHRNASFDSNTQCRTATDMFNDMHGTSTELVEDATNYTGPAMHYDGPKHASKMGNTDAGTGTDGGHTARWRGGIEYGTFKGV